MSWTSASRTSSCSGRIYPDDFVFDLLDLAPGAVMSAAMAQLASLKKPPQTMDQLLDTLRSQGLGQSVARFREDEDLRADPHAKRVMRSTYSP